MDVGAPSNFERMQAMYGGVVDAMRQDVAGVRLHGRAGGPGHRRRLPRATATCWIRTARSAGWPSTTRWRPRPAGAGVFLATAHPAKFREVVEPAIGRPVPLPPCAGGGAAAPRHAHPLPADYAALRALLRDRRPCQHPRPIVRRPASSRARATFPIATDGTCRPSAATGTTGRRLSAARRGDRRPSRAFQRHAGGRARRAAGRAAGHGRRRRPQLSRLVLRGAALRRGPARQRGERPAPAGADPFARQQQASAWFNPEVLAIPLETIRQWMQADEALAVYRSRSSRCSTSRSTCSTSRASGCCRTPAGSTAARPTAIRR